jgi:hypothetical protein
LRRAASVIARSSPSHAVAAIVWARIDARQSDRRRRTIAMSRSPADGARRLVRAVLGEVQPSGGMEGSPSPDLKPFLDLCLRGFRMVDEARAILQVRRWIHRPLEIGF